MFECVNTKMHAGAGFISGVRGINEQIQASPHTTEDVAHSSAYSVRFSLGMHQCCPGYAKQSTFHERTKIIGRELCAEKQEESMRVTATYLTLSSCM